MNQTRANIRNAYFAEDTDVILDAWNAFMSQDRREEAKYLRELLNESMDEIEQTKLIV